MIVDELFTNVDANRDRHVPAGVYPARIKEIRYNLGSGATKYLSVSAEITGAKYKRFVVTTFIATDNASSNATYWGKRKLEGLVAATHLAEGEDLDETIGCDVLLDVSVYSGKNGLTNDIREFLDPEEAF